MKRSILVTGVIAVAVIAAMAMAGRWRSGAPETAPAQRSGPAADRATPGSAGASPPTLEFSASDVTVVSVGALEQRVPLTGSLRPVNQTIVKSKVAGEIQAFSVREGMRVRAAEVIARIDAAEFEMRVREREASLRASEANLAQARRTLENTQALFDRSFVSQSALDSARFALDAALGNRDAASAQLQLARKSLAETEVAAPISGIVGERFAQVGEKVSADSRLLSIVDLSKMEIEAPVPASEVAGVRIGQTVQLRIEGIERVQSGRVTRIAPGTLPGTRSVPIYIQLDNDDPTVRAGMFAHGTIATGRRDRVLLAPLPAVRDAAGRQFVYVIVDDRLVERTVRTGLRDESARTSSGGIGLVEIAEGLEAGERIVARNLGQLRPGSHVRVAAPLASPDGQGK